MKPIKVENEAIIEAANSDFPYIEVDNRKFLLFEVEEISDPGIYEVYDGEELLLLEALKGNNPILSEREIDKMLADSKEWTKGASKYFWSAIPDKKRWFRPAGIDLPVNFLVYQESDNGSSFFRVKKECLVIISLIGDNIMFAARMRI